jgi:excinuclease UvrABC nuclease subunit
MQRAATEQRFERAAALRRRHRRLRVVLGSLGGVLEATHARPRLLLAAHPNGAEFDGFWISGGRLVDWGSLGPGDLDQLASRTVEAIARGGRLGELGAHVPPAEVDEVRILGSWLASHPDTPRLALSPAPDRVTLEAFLERASALERKLDDDRLDLVGADRDV